MCCFGNIICKWVIVLWDKDCKGQVTQCSKLCAWCSWNQSLKGDFCQNISFPKKLIAGGPCLPPLLQCHMVLRGYWRTLSLFANSRVWVSCYPCFFFLSQCCGWVGKCLEIVLADKAQSARICLQNEIYVYIISVVWLFFSTCKPVGNQGALVEPKEFFTVMEVAFSPASPLAGNTRYIAFLLSHNLWQTYMLRHYIHFFTRIW